MQNEINQPPEDYALIAPDFPKLEHFGAVPELK